MPTSKPALKLYLWFEGRKKEIIIRDGVNISP
jgi:acyl-CoA synthetase (AMP-forming)/AMP-acid ligase II